MSEPQEQHRKQYDWLKGYQFAKGESGNPGGRPKGSKSLKTFVKEYLEQLPELEKIEFLQSLPPEMVWRMAEGNPETKTDITSDGKPLILPSVLINKNDDINALAGDSRTGQA